MSQGRGSVFVCYSRADTEWKDRIVRHLRVPSNGFDAWSDAEITLGDDWRRAIAQAIARASIGIFLVSPESLTSRFILHEEIPRLLSLAAQQRLRFIPVLVRDAAYSTVSWLEPLQWFPRDRKPLAARSPAEVDALLVQLVMDIHALSEAQDPRSDVFRVEVIDFAPRDRAAAGLAIAQLLQVDPARARMALERGPVVVGQSSGSKQADQVLRRLRAAHIPATRYRLSNDYALEARRGPQGIALMRVQPRERAALSWMIHPVTRALYGAVMGGGEGRENPLHPMAPLRRSDVEALCARLNQAPDARGRFRLPTPQEWLRAAQGGDADGFAPVRWQRQACMGTTRPAEVCTREPNGWGLFDMPGNVEEWTEARGAGVHAVCGGSFRSDSSTFDLSCPREVSAEACEPTFGARLVMEEP